MLLKELPGFEEPYPISYPLQLLLNKSKKKMLICTNRFSFTIGLERRKNENEYSSESKNINCRCNYDSAM